VECDSCPPVDERKFTILNSKSLLTDSSHTYKGCLFDICHGRSGDKGDVANIGIICRNPLFYDLLLKKLTPTVWNTTSSYLANFQVVKEYLGHLIQGEVNCYPLPGISGLNFVCTKALGGGGLESLNMDRQGKCYAQLLLEIPIDIPRGLVYFAKL
jgi:hypothetical protein